MQDSLKKHRPRPTNAGTHFLCLAHNLIQLFERHLAAEYQIRNVAQDKRRARRLAAQQRRATARGATLPALVPIHQRLTQTNVN